MSYTRIGAVAGVVLAVLCAQSFLQAKVAVVTTTQGKTLEGELISESEDTITLRISGIATPVRRANISKITYRKSPKEEYLSRRAALKDDDVNGRLKLARDFFDRELLTYANIELQSLKKAFPKNEDVQLLATIVEERLKLEAANAARRDAATKTPGRTAPVKPKRPTRADAPERLAEDDMLTPEQINLLRLWELPGDLSQMRSQIVVPRETVEKFLEQYAQEEVVPRGRSDQDRFRRQPDWRKLDVMFKARARPLYEEVEIRGDPPVILAYRQGIYRGYIAAYFYKHFGQGQYPGLYLYGPDTGARGAMTNLYILSTFRVGGKPLIDRNEPERSLLLQWGLPRDVAYDPAPEVEGWRPFFRPGSNEARFGQFVDWIATLYPDVDYGIAYSLPVPPSVKEKAAADAGEDAGSGDGAAKRVKKKKNKNK